MARRLNPAPASPRASRFHPSLPPGALLTRHDGEHLRIGNWPGVVVVDTALTRALIAEIDGVRDVDHVCTVTATRNDTDPQLVRDLLDDLVSRGAVVDATPWLRARAPRDEVLAALLREREPTSADRRIRTVLAVHASPGCVDVAEMIGLGARAGGVSTRRDRPADVQVVVTNGEPHRDSIEALVATGTSVLPVALADGRVVIGPWVDPGRTPCLTCSDLNRKQWDPSWAGHWPSLDRSDRPHGVGVEVMLAAASVAVADLLDVCDRRRPRTVGARITIGPDPAVASRLDVDFSDSCACHLLSGPMS